MPPEKPGQGGQPQNPAPQPEGGQPQQPAQPAPQSPEGGSFVDQVQDQSLREWAQAKGWKDVDSVLKSAHNLEKMVGAPADEMIRLPKDADEAQTRSVLQKLGMPEKPDGYEIPVRDDLPLDKEFQNWSRDAFHKAGLTSGQAKALAEQYNEFVAGHYQKSDQDYQVQVQAEEQALQREWGNGFDRQMGLAKRAASELGFDADTLDALETVHGYAGTMKFLAGLGKRLGEDNFVSADERREGFHGRMTPAEARQAWADMAGDAEMMKALQDKQHPNHQNAMEKKTRLFQIMYPAEAA